MNINRKLIKTLDILIFDTYGFSKLASSLKGINNIVINEEKFLEQLRKEYDFGYNMNYYRFYGGFKDIKNDLELLVELNIISDSNLLRPMDEKILVWLNDYRLNSQIIDFPNNKSFFIGDKDKLEFLKEYINNKGNILSGKDLLEAENIIEDIKKIGFDKIYYGLELPDYVKIKEPSLFVYYLKYKKSKYLKKVLLYIEGLSNENFDNNNFFDEIVNSSNKGKIIKKLSKKSITLIDGRIFNITESQSELLKLFINNNIIAGLSIEKIKDKLSVLSEDALKQMKNRFNISMRKQGCLFRITKITKKEYWKLIYK